MPTVGKPPLVAVGVGVNVGVPPAVAVGVADGVAVKAGKPPVPAATMTKPRLNAASTLFSLNCNLIV